MLALRTYFSKQIEEIRSDTAVRIYGALIMFGYFLCFVQWRPMYIAKHMASPSEVYCWPFFENCFAYRPFTADQVHLIIVVYGIIAFLGIPLFLSRKYCALGYWWLVMTTVFKTLIYVQDYALRMNQHYMLYFITLVFLFLPYKRQLLRVTMVLFYFWASTLKFNVEWMSGEALTTKPLGVPWRLLPASCVYAAILESLIVWGVLSANRRIFWFALSQLFLFHVMSWTVVGYFYPTLMFALLAIFPLTALIPDPTEPKSLLKSLFTGQQPLVIYLFILFFSCLQLIPVVMPGDEKITGEGRLFALHMIDAKVRCQGAITLKFKDGTSQEISIPLKDSIKRTQCEPAMNFSLAKRSCYLYRADPNFKNLDIYYEARKATEENMRPLVDIKNFCDQDLSYHMLRPNDWIIRNKN